MVFKYYPAYLTIAPSSPQQIYLDDFRALVDEQFENAPNILTVKWNGVDTLARVTSKILETNLYRDRDKYRQVIFKEPTQKASVGDIFEFQGYKWLCIQTDNLSVGVNDCAVERADNIIKFYDENLNLNEIPCIVGDISIGVDSNQYISTASNEVPLIVPNISATRQIKLGEVFKIGLQNYSISGIGDDVSRVGLIIFKMSFSEVEQVLPVFGVQILNGDVLSTNTITPVQLNVQTLKDNIVLSPTLPLTYSSSNALVATVNSSGLVVPLTTGSVVISCKLTSDVTISDSITINVVSVPQENLTYTLVGNSLPDTEIKSGITKTYVAHKYNNGVEVVGADFVFSAITGSTPSSAYTFAVIDDVSCSLKCNQYTYYVTLRATDISDNTKYIEKIIKLRSVL